MLALADSDWGPMHIAASSRGITAAELLGTREGFEAGLARRRFQPIALDDAAPGPARDLALVAAAAAARALSGDAVDLVSLPIDIGDRPAWDRLVLGAVRGVERGQVASYGEIARRVGRPGAARAVGGAVGRNPVGLFVPCHRVIAANGRLGGYGAAAWGGVEAALALKRDLLALEGVHVE